MLFILFAEPHTPMSVLLLKLIKVLKGEELSASLRVLTDTPGALEVWNQNQPDVKQSKVLYVTFRKHLSTMTPVAVESTAVSILTLTCIYVYLCLCLCVLCVKLHSLAHLSQLCVQLKVAMVMVTAVSLLVREFIS